MIKEQKSNVCGKGVCLSHDVDIVLNNNRFTERLHSEMEYTWKSLQLKEWKNCDYVAQRCLKRLRTLKYYSIKNPKSNML